MELTPEERRRIYLEEKARIEISGEERDRIYNEDKEHREVSEEQIAKPIVHTKSRNAGCLMLIGLVVLLAIYSFFKSTSEPEGASTTAAAPTTAAVPTTAVAYGQCLGLPQNEVEKLWAAAQGASQRSTNGYSPKTIFRLMMHSVITGDLDDTPITAKETSCADRTKF